MSKARVSIFLVIICLLGLLPLRAVIIGDGNGNTTAPTLDPAWANVGSSAQNGPLGGVYLGRFANGRWLITAKHVPFSTNTLYLEGKAYALVPGSEVIIQDGSDEADLHLFRVEENSALDVFPNLTLPNNGTSPQIGDSVVMIGWGRDGVFPVDAQGRIAIDATVSKRWGTNLVTNGQITIPQPSPATTTQAFTTTFESASGDEAQGVSGDSGGATFFRKNDDWVLAGIMFTVNQQTSGYVSPDDQTYHIRLASYLTQIQAITGAATAPETPITSWRDHYFGQTTDTGDAADNADSDDDGIVNLLEYALHTSPQDSDLRWLPRIEVINDAGDNYLVMTFRRVTNRTDINYYIEASDTPDAASWTIIAQSLAGAATTAENGGSILDESGNAWLNRIRVKDAIPLTDTRFLRLRVERL